MAETVSTEKIVRERSAPPRTIIIDIEGEGAVVRTVWHDMVDAPTVIVRNITDMDFNLPDVCDSMSFVDERYSEYMAQFPECHRCHDSLPDPKQRVYSETDDDVCWCVDCADIEAEKTEAAERARLDDLDPEADEHHYEAVRDGC